MFQADLLSKFNFVVSQLTQISKMWFTIFSPSKLTEILRNNYPDSSLLKINNIVQIFITSVNFKLIQRRYVDRLHFGKLIK